MGKRSVARRQTSREVRMTAVPPTAATQAGTSRSAQQPLHRIQREHNRRRRPTPVAAHLPSNCRCRLKATAAGQAFCPNYSRRRSLPFFFCQATDSSTFKRGHSTAISHTGGRATASRQHSRPVATRCGPVRTQSEAVARWQEMRGFVVYLYLYKNQVLASNTLI